MKKIIILVCLILAAASVSAQELPGPGITPDSPFYFLDTMFDGFQSPEAVADEKAAEVVAMAQENKVEALTKARERYEKAMQKRTDRTQTEEDAEEVTEQSTNHIEVLSGVLEQVPEEAKAGIEEAMKNSAEARKQGIDKINETNPERARAVAEATLKRIMENAPEQALPGLNRALDSVKANVPEQAGEASGSIGPEKNESGMAENRRP